MQDLAKRAAAEAALTLLPEAGVIGLGTGTTARFFIEGVARLVASGRALRCIATSTQSREQAASLGIPLLDEAGPWQVDVCVDGADEVDPRFDLIKGGGGALLREKIVNHAARTNVIVIDRAKLSPALGTRWPLPVEVARFGHGSTAAALSAHGRPVLRAAGDEPFVSDGGNHIYDLHTGPIADARALEKALRSLPGVVETGLFLSRAQVVLAADPEGHVETLRPGA